MKITEILAQEGNRLSFEVFPPKVDSLFTGVREAVREIAALRPSFISVTYGAGGGTSRYTREIAEEILRDHRVPSLAHLTCVSSDRATVRQRLAELKASGIENVWLCAEI